jgi:hypothetical protein
MAPWVIGAIGTAAVFFFGLAYYFYFHGDSYLMHISGAAIAAFAIAALLDAAASKIVLDPETLLVISLFRRRAFARTDFISAKVDGGVVVLKRKDGAWVILPGTGHDALAIRNRIDAWIKNDPHATDLPPTPRV